MVWEVAAILGDLEKPTTQLTFKWQWSSRKPLSYEGLSEQVDLIARTFWIASFGMHYKNDFLECCWLESVLYPGFLLEGGASSRQGVGTAHRFQQAYSGVSTIKLTHKQASSQKIFSRCAKMLVGELGVSLDYH